jgi:hypothetical protein
MIKLFRKTNLIFKMSKKNTKRKLIMYEGNNKIQKIDKFFKKKDVNKEENENEENNENKLKEEETKLNIEKEENESKNEKELSNEDKLKKEEEKKFKLNNLIIGAHMSIS